MSLRELLRKLLGLPDPVPPPPPPPPKPLPEVERDVAYGPDALQTMDIYRPAGMVEGDTAPVIFMVHGGGWDNTKGDKANSGVIVAKVAYYVPRGYIVFSINYRLYTPTNGITPLQEAQDVAAALAFAQKLPGCGPSRFTLMGHSAGAQLVALVATWNPQGVTGTVCLDGIYDVELAKKVDAKTGNDQYAPFGSDPSKWPAMSPIDNVSAAIRVLLCYSTTEGKQRKTQADNFAARIEQFDGDATAQGFALEHAEMDSMVGLPGPLTDAIDKFLG